METKCGFLPWQLDNDVLNFLTGCSPNGIRLFFTASYRAVEQFHQCLNHYLVPMVFAVFPAHRRSTMPPCLPPDTLSVPICIANILPRACLLAWTRANPGRTSRRFWPLDSRKRAHRWPSRECSLLPELRASSARMSLKPAW